MADTARGTRILKVNHAGENGAVHIYAGQIAMARWTAAAMQARASRWWRAVITPVVAASTETETVIWLGMRL